MDLRRPTGPKPHDKYMYVGNPAELGMNNSSHVRITPRAPWNTEKELKSEKEVRLEPGLEEQTFIGCECRRTS